MLFAWGSEDREQERLGRAISCDGGMDFVEEAEESDFWVWEGMACAACEGRPARWAEEGGWTRLRRSVPWAESRRKRELR